MTWIETSTKFVPKTGQRKRDDVSQLIIQYIYKPVTEYDRMYSRKHIIIKITVQTVYVHVQVYYMVISPIYA